MENNATLCAPFVEQCRGISVASVVHVALLD